MTQSMQSTQGAQALRDTLNYIIHKDLLNIICEYLEMPASMKLLLSEFSATYKYDEGYRQLIKHNAFEGHLKSYNYAEINRYTFESRVRFIGSLGHNIFNKRSQVVGKLPNRYFATLAPCDLS